jgi:hypothetical protein
MNAHRAQRQTGPSQCLDRAPCFLCEDHLLPAGHTASRTIGTSPPSMTQPTLMWSVGSSPTSNGEDDAIGSML